MDASSVYLLEKIHRQQAQNALFADPRNTYLVLAEREAYLDYRRQEKIFESFLRQKSKITWLRFEDDNTTYFHASLKKRKMTNRIVSYILDDGSIVNDYEKVTHHFLHHFQSFMGCVSRANGHIDMQSITCGPILDLDSQMDLIKPFTFHDVKVALFSIHPVKSPSPDGYGASFFNDMWKEIGREVSLAVLKFFETGLIPESLNDTLLVLILMVDQPFNTVDFRPITCCTTIYKCISKMLCSRLASVLPSLINPNQGAFIKHRSLAYNVLIFQDLIKGYNRKNSSPRFQGQFKGGKGLRKGDPISPLLFVIVMDYLTRMLMKASKDKGFRFYPMCKSLNLVNLCFADDLLIFCKANSQSVQIFHKALAEFNLASGLSINHSKSRIYFGGLSDSAKINYWMNIFMLPQDVVRDIDRLCRNYLWGEKGSRSKFHLASCEFVYRPKAYGGLGFQERPVWNKVLIAKFLRAIYYKQVQLWVKWVNTIYLKGVPIRDYTLKQDDSWYWRKLIKMSHFVSGPALAATVVHSHLRLGKLYTQFISGAKIDYGPSVWCKLSVPKHRFVLWQAVNNHLLTRDLLHISHVNIPSLTCPVCTQVNESHSHLFF
ncbi:uncharacterized protein LOC133779742 [Humulus lupulus]|uniref:uncharacterized protein LOC133779742 n=1 Tax=Humulus lupulus TaxID=3486 RepID=UPI002B40EB02|nr:uncharacterized protein LOC133779742 [Humulus lupulus]